MINILLGFLIIALFAAAQASVEKLKFHYYKSVFVDLNPAFWDPSISWKRKYRDKFWLFKKLPWLNDTVLVWITDGYHILRLISILIFISGLIFVQIINFKLIAIPLFFIAYGAIFELFFSKLLVRK